MFLHLTLIVRSQSPWPCRCHLLNSSWQPEDQQTSRACNHRIIYTYLTAISHHSLIQWFRNGAQVAMGFCLSPGLCGCTAWTQDRPCPQRRLYTSRAAGPQSGAALVPPWGKSTSSHWKGTLSRYKWAFVWYKRRTAAPGSRDEASWFELKEKEVMSLFSQQRLQKLHFPEWRYHSSYSQQRPQPQLKTPQSQ